MGWGTVWVMNSSLAAMIAEGVYVGGGVILLIVIVLLIWLLFFRR